MSDEWYYIDAQGNQQGPVNVPSLKQLFQGKKINGDSFCWSSSIPDWAAIKDVPGLMDKLQEAPAPAPAPVMAKPAIVLPFGPGQSPFANLQRPAPTASATPVKAATPVVASPSPTPAASSASATAAAISAMAARPQAPGKLEPLGAPEPVSTGAAAQPLTIVRKDGPAHGWKALKSADGQEYYYNTVCFDHVSVSLCQCGDCSHFLTVNYITLFLSSKLARHSGTSLMCSRHRTITSALVSGFGPPTTCTVMCPHAKLVTMAARCCLRPKMDNRCPLRGSRPLLSSL